jgi:hypothetical protein
MLSCFCTYSPLIIIPGHEFYEVGVEGDARLGIEDGGVGVAIHISGDDLILRVSQYA